MNSVGKRMLYPVLLPFPIWRFGPTYSEPDGAWYPDRYGVRVVELWP